MKSKFSKPRSHQPTPLELRDELLRFISSQFYPGRTLQFTKDTPRLLKWVVLKLAEYLDERGVSIGTDRYLEIMRGILMDALRFGDTGNITYLPAWLGKVVESHLRIRGEQYYDEGKALRNHLDAALKTARSGVQGRNPVHEMATASRLLKAKKRPINSPSKHQLNLF